MAGRLNHKGLKGALARIGAGILACIALSACSHGASQSTGTASPGERPSKTIGVSIQNREAQFYQDMESGMRAAAAKYGYALVVVDASRDNARQQSQVEDFISKRVDAIVLTPYDSEAIGSAITEANTASIPVFTADIASTSKEGKVVAHVASDNVQGGFAAGKLICQAVGKSGAVAIVDEPEVTSVQDRVKGFKQALAQLCPSVTIVADVDSGGTRDKASSDTGDILQAHRDLKGIFGINDDSALGALAAVKAAGLTGKVSIVGYDATPEARLAIAAGEMYGDAIQYPAKIGSTTVDVIHDYFAGKTPPPIVKIGVGTFTRANTPPSP
ncbi:MAG: substrate-binding domain-containing protein [Candidatus Eremiobacteraeota bacterium]|nr:substrate-binding domain-containing protein [Candidatus Eremiobacteraeota bacterium]